VPDSNGIRRLFDVSAGDVVDARVYARDALKVDDQIKGPAVVTEAETTIIVPTGFDATLRSDGTIELTRMSQGARS
jgi:N-methylhydantoinase A